MDNTITIIVSAIVMSGMVILIAPKIFAANKGVILRNIAIWIGIFLFLALVYKIIEPQKNMVVYKKNNIDKEQSISDFNGISTAK